MPVLEEGHNINNNSNNNNSNNNNNKRSNKRNNDSNPNSNANVPWESLPGKTKHIVESLCRGNTRPQLVDMCRAKGLTVRGTKTFLATQIASKLVGPPE